MFAAATKLLKYSIWTLRLSNLFKQMYLESAKPSLIEY